MRLTSKILMAVILFTAVSASAQQPIPQGAMILMKTYSHFVKGYENGYLLISDGTKSLYDDRREKTFLQKLDDSDPEDMFAFKYDRNSWTPEYLQDAGRSRCEPLFKKMYGASEAEVRKSLVSVDWFGGKVLFTKNNGVGKTPGTSPLPQVIRLIPVAQGKRCQPPECPLLWHDY